MTSPILVAYGAGTNSTAILVGMWEHGIRPDAILFADTGGEEPETYAYLNVMNRWLAEREWPQIEVVKRAHDNEETLEANCLRFGKLPSVAYGYKMCSQEFKRRPQERWARKWDLGVGAWSVGEQVTKVIGFDADEPYRKDRIKDDKKYRYVFYLIEWDWGRAECIEAIQRAGLPLPGKSSCFFCPNRKPSQVVALGRRHPDLAARAVAMEHGAAAEDRRTGIRSEIVGLARRWTWEAILGGAARQVDMFEREMPCDCYDGGDD